MPGAGRVRSSIDGGQMKGGAPRAVWLTLGADPELISAHSAAERLNQLERSPHLVWNPVTGEAIQLIPIVRAACSLGPYGEAGQEGRADLAVAGLYMSGPLAVAPRPGEATSVNNEGRLCVQVGVVAFGWDPFTSGPVKGLPEILEWIDAWGVERRWPAGRPPAFAHAHTTPRSRRLWARGGHYGASQVPCCPAGGPGAIDVDLMMGGPAGLEAEVAAALGGGAARPRAAAVSTMSDMRGEDEHASALARAG
jgi:hypothetical protein